MARHFRLVAALALALALPAAGWAGMALDRSIVHLNPGDPESVDVAVANNGDEPLYVDASVAEVVAPGSPAEERVLLRASADVPMLVSPNKLVIPPGQRRLLRIVNMAGHSDTERVFRVTAKPVAPPVVAERSGIRILVGYQVLVIVAPTDPKPNLESHRNGRELVLENHGNVNFMLHSGVQCAPGVEVDDVPAGEDKEGCIRFDGNRLYPGNAWKLETQWDTPVLFTVTTGERNDRRRF
jgi:P pilus assembly chaperone PapD